MISTTLKRFSHKVGLNFWHLEWCPKYRYEMMRKYENKNLVAAAIRKAAHEHGIVIHYLAVMPDHIHALATFPHGMTDSKALNLLKGRSAYIIFRVKEKFRLRYPQGHFWSPGGCAVTVGYNDLNSMIHYIENQEEHHNVTFT
jgi:putative transposase